MRSVDPKLLEEPFVVESAHLLFKKGEDLLFPLAASLPFAGSF